MIKRTDNEVICYHEKFRSIDRGDKLGVWIQCKDCFDTFPLKDKINKFTTYESQFFDDIQKWSKENLEKDRKNPAVVINENL